MERPAKRIRSGGTSRLAAAENEDELVLRPEEVNQRRDPGYQSHMRTAWLKSRFESIFEKYGNPDLGSDEIDLRTGEVVTDNGHIQALGERNVEDAVEALADDQEALILRGNGPQLPKNPSFLGIVPGISQTRLLLPPSQPPPPFATSSISLDPFGPRDPKWQVPELPQLSFGNGMNEFLASMPTRRVSFKRPLGLLQEGANADDEEEDDVLLGLPVEARNSPAKVWKKPLLATPRAIAAGKQSSFGSAEQSKPASSVEAPARNEAGQEKKQHEKNKKKGHSPEMRSQESDIPPLALTDHKRTTPKTRRTTTTAAEGSRERVAIKSRKEPDLSPSLEISASRTLSDKATGHSKLDIMVSRKPIGQTLLVELSDNIVSKSEYRLLTPEETPFETDAAAESSGQDLDHLGGDRLVTTDISGTETAIAPTRNGETMATQIPSSRRQNTSIYTTNPEARAVASQTASLDIDHKRVRPRRAASSKKSTDSAGRYSRNTVDPAYEFSDEDETSSLLPRSQGTIEQPASKRSQSIGHLLKSRRYETILHTTSTDFVGPQISNVDDATHFGNSDKENMSCTGNMDAKAKGNRKNRALPAQHRANNPAALPMMDNLVLSMFDEEESPEAQLCLEEAIAQEKALAERNKALQSVGASGIHHVINLARSPTYAKRTCAMGEAGMQFSATPVRATRATGHPGAAKSPQEPQSCADNTTPKTSTQGPVQHASLLSKSRDGVLTHPRTDAVVERSNSSSSASSELPVQAEISPSITLTRSVNRTYSTRAQRRRISPVTPVKGAPAQNRDLKTASDSKPPASVKTSLLSLISSSDDEDELSMGPDNLTPSSRRSVLHTSTLLAPSPSAVRKSKLKTTLAERSHSKPRTPQRRTRGFHPYPSSGKGSSSKKTGLGSARKRGGDSQSSPIKRIIGPEPSEELFPTPGGTMRRCGEAGFRCDRDFCMTCE